MLVKFTPEQVAQLWPMMASGIDSALPPYVGDRDDRLRNILTAVLAGMLECWISYDVIDGNAKIYGVVLTAMKVDDFSMSKYLLIYAVYGVGSSTNRNWVEGYNTLRRYALDNGCETIVAYSCVPEIISMANRLGGDTRYQFLQLPVNLPSMKISS